MPTPPTAPEPPADDAAAAADVPFAVRIERERLPDGRSVTYYSASAGQPSEAGPDDATAGR